MRMRSRSQLRHRFYRHLFVLTSVLVVMMGLPSQVFRMRLVGVALLILLLLAELGQVIPKFMSTDKTVRFGDRQSSLIYRCVGIIVLVALVIWMFTPARTIATGFPILMMLTVFVFWSLQRLLRLLGREERVTRDVIAGAVAGYLLLGISGGLLLSVVETLQPGSFQNLVHEGRHIRTDLIAEYDLDRLIWDLDFSRINYFAFVSLTTVGYGDIVPVRPLAEMTSVTLSLVGPLYVAMVMGLLISRFTLEVQTEQDLEEQNAAEHQRGAVHPVEPRQQRPEL